MVFAFSLQPVLDHRQAKEEKAQREYGDALGRLEGIRRRRREVENDIETRGEQVRRKQRTGLSFAEREIIERWIQTLQEQLKRLDQEERQLAEQAEQCRLRLLKAVQDLKVMEKLREKEWADYRLDEARADLRRFDEIAVRDYVNAHRRREKNAQSRERIA